MNPNDALLLELLPPVPMLLVPTEGSNIGPVTAEGSLAFKPEAYCSGWRLAWPKDEMFTLVTILEYT